VQAEEAESVGGDANWAAERLAAMEASEQVQAEAAQFALNFLWLDKNIAVAVDQVFGKGHRSPVTEYFFWPRRDAWEDLKAALEGKPWVEEREKVLLLNRCTEVINFWQDENKHSLSEAQEKFPDCRFQGS
jgi:30S ribosomal protein 3